MVRQGFHQRPGKKPYTNQGNGCPPVPPAPRGRQDVRAGGRVAVALLSIWFVHGFVVGSTWQYNVSQFGIPEAFFRLVKVEDGEMTFEESGLGSLYVRLHSRLRAQRQCMHDGRAYICNMHV